MDSVPRFPPSLKLKLGSSFFKSAIECVPCRQFDGQIWSWEQGPSHWVRMPGRSSQPRSVYLTIQPKRFDHKFFDPSIFGLVCFLTGPPSSHVFFVHHVFCLDWLSHVTKRSPLDSVLWHFIQSKLGQTVTCITWTVRQDRQRSTNPWINVPCALT
jgi:hypothetical protein